VSEGGHGLKNFSKKAVFSVSSGKNQISPLLAPHPRKTFGKSTIGPLEKIFPMPMYINVKLHHF